MSVGGLPVAAALKAFHQGISEDSKSDEGISPDSARNLDRVDSGDSSGWSIAADDEMMKLRSVRRQQQLLIRHLLHGVCCRLCAVAVMWQ